MGAARRRRNLRSSAVTLFRWARRRKYLPHELTAAEMLESPRVTRKIQETYTPKQMAAMLAACPVPYLPWLIFSAFHGLRYSELFPPYKSDKSPLDWSDVDRARGLIIVRPETSKLAERRVIKLQPHAADWLPNTAKGRVTPEKPPDKVHKLGKSVTTILGDLVGGWKSNALRNSFISYRAAQIGLAMTALEAGNSESEARRSYHDAKSKEDGDEWFAILAKGPQVEAGEIAS
jgi:integrase